MLKLIEGGFFAGGKEKIAELILKRTEKKEKTLLIVPEQQTVTAEREMTDILPPSSPLFFEATNFTRLANSIFRALGGLSRKKADKAKRALIMWRTLTELSPMLQTVGKGKEITYGTVSRMLSTVEQIQSFALDASALNDACTSLANSDKLYDARLTSKLNDISAVIALYTRLLSDKFCIGEDELIIARNKLAELNSDFLSDTEIFIDGFTSFTEPQYLLISELLKKCSVTINLIIPKESPDAFEYTEVKNVHKRLTKIASKENVEVTLQKLGGIHKNKDPLICDTVNLLWRSRGKLDEELASSESIKIFEAQDPYEECDIIAGDIKRRVMNGAKYSEFGIIARSLSPYEEILSISFDKAKIPLFISSRTDIGAYEVIKLIYSAFSVIAGGYERRDVISYSKCSLSGVDISLADEFELYTEKWQIDKSRFSDGIMWNMNPSGYTDRRTEKDEEKLLLIDKAKDAIISPLLLLDESLQGAETVKDYTSALINFLLHLNTEEKLKEKSKEAEILVGAKASDELSRLWQIICDSLDSLCDVAGELKTDARTYLNLLKITFAETNIGRIPAFAEQVTAADAESAHMNEKKHIYILGANAGEFPGIFDDNSYFTSSDKRTLCTLGLPIEDDENIKSARELYLFSRALSYAKKSLTVTYHASDASLKPTPRSDAVNKIKELSFGKISPIKILELKLADRSFYPEYALEHLDECGENAETFKKAIFGTEFKNQLHTSEKNIKNSKLKLSKDSVSLLYGNKIRMTQSRLEKYVKCPMSYFCTYNLSLNAEERIEFDAKNIGTFIHSVLENFFLKLRKEGKEIASTSEEERINLIKTVASDYTERCFEGIPKTSARIKNTIDKICRAAKPIVDSLCDEFSNCKYTPTFFELEIEDEKDCAISAPKFKTKDGKEVYLCGKVDRVDVYNGESGSYIRVIDYKSGNKLFSPADIEEGLNLQMFLYLKSIVTSDDADFRKRMDADEKTKLIPAGVIYVKTDISEAKISHNNPDEAFNAVKKNQARVGMLLDSEESISAMNCDFLPIKFKKDGTLDNHSKDKIYTEDGWEKISETLDRVISDICDKVTKGDIPAYAFFKKGEKSPCNYCDFKAICRNAKI